MSIDATSWVWNFSQTEGTDRLVLLALADYANFHEEGLPEEAEECAGWPSKSALAKMVRMDAQTIRRSLRKAEELGEITSAPYQGWQGRPDKRPNRYVFLHVKSPAQRGVNLYPRSDGGSGEIERGVSPDHRGGSERSPKPIYKPILNQGENFSKNQQSTVQPPDYSDQPPLPPQAPKESLQEGLRQAREALKPTEAPQAPEA